MGLKLLISKLNLAQIRSTSVLLCLRPVSDYLNIAVVLPLFIVMRILQPLITFRISKIEASRVGLLTQFLDCFVSGSEVNHKLNRKYVVRLFYMQPPISNETLVKMWKRRIAIVPLSKYLGTWDKLVPGGITHVDNIHWNVDISIQDRSKPPISFSSEEEVAGKRYMSEIGLSEQAFVCFHSRDKSYLDRALPDRDWRYHNYRDADIHRCLPAIKELNKLGFTGVRMGAVVDQPIDQNVVGIIDYATKYRSDFMDIYLLAKAHFLISSSMCGLTNIPIVFRKPVVCANVTPLISASFMYSKCIFIPKGLWLKSEKRFMTLVEIIESQAYLESDKFGDDIEVVENEAAAITAVAIEMAQRLSGEWKQTSEDDELQEKFRTLYDRHIRPSRLLSPLLARIGAEYLRRTPDWLC